MGSSMIDKMSANLLSFIENLMYVTEYMNMIELILIVSHKQYNSWPTLYHREL